ncbi:omptin family outer membrane protease [Escherichia coli]|nr:omptin family outer membrane protease [Escherichia coli]
MSKKIFLPKTNEWNGVNLSMYLKVLDTALSVPVVFAALASDTGLSFTPEKISTEIGFGTLSGKAKERVSLPEEKGRKASQSDWEYSNAAIVKSAFNRELLPTVSFGASGWTTLAGSGGKYGWLDTSNPGT